MSASIRERVRSDGTISVSAEVAHEAGFAPGDDVLIVHEREGDIRVVRVEYLTPTELAARYPIEESIDLHRLREEWEQNAAQEVIAEMERNVRRLD